MYVVFGIAFRRRIFMSATKYPSGIAFGVTLTPPSPGPTTATAVAVLVPVGFSYKSSGGVEWAQAASAAREKAINPPRWKYREVANSDGLVPGAPRPARMLSDSMFESPMEVAMHRERFTQAIGVAPPNLSDEQSHQLFWLDGHHIQLCSRVLTDRMEISS